MDQDPQIPRDRLRLGIEGLGDEGCFVFLAVFPVDEVSLHAGDNFHVVQDVGAHRVGRHAELILAEGIDPGQIHFRRDGEFAVEILVESGLYGSRAHTHQRAVRPCHAAEFLVGVLRGRPVEHDACEDAAGQVEPCVLHVRGGDAAVAAVQIVGHEPGGHATGLTRAERPVGIEFHLPVFVRIGP